MPSLKADDVGSSVQFMRLLENSLDITGAEIVEVVINEQTRVLHVNVNGVCVLRVCRVKDFEVDHNAATKEG